MKVYGRMSTPGRNVTVPHDSLHELTIIAANAIIRIGR